MSKILLIDGETTLRERLHDLLCTQGYEIVAAFGLQSGIEAAIVHGPDIIACDQTNDGMDEVLLQKKLSEQPKAAHIPVIFLVEANQQIQARIHLKEADELLVKPVTAEMLVLAINECFQKQEFLNERTQKSNAHLRAMLESIANLTKILENKDSPPQIPPHQDSEALIHKAVEQLLHRNEKGIMEREGDFGALLDNIGIGVYRGSTDAQGQFLHANPAMARMFGFGSVPEFMAMPIADLYANADERRQYVEEIRLHRTVKNKVLRMHRRDGELLWIEVTAQGHFDEQGKLVWVEGILNDITEQKRAESDLMIERDLLWNLMNQIPDQIYFKDLDSKFTRINAQQARILGLASPEDAIGKSDYDFFDHAAQAFVDEQMILNTGRPLINKAEYIRTASGEYRWASSTKARIVSHSGEVIGLVGITRDIHEMKQGEEALAQRVRLAALNADIGSALTQEGSQRAILQACAQALVSHLEGAFARIWIYDKSNNLLELQASAGLYTNLDGLYGRVPMGKGKIGLIAQDRKPYITNAVAGDPRTTDSEWARREGLVAFVGYPLLIEDRLLGVMAMFTRHPLPMAVVSALDVAAKSVTIGIERKQAEETLRQSEELFRLITENAVDLIAVINREDQWLYQSPSFEKILGYTPKEFQEMGIYDAIHPDDRNRVASAMKESFRTGQFTRMEFRMRHKDGSYRSIESTASAIFNGEGEPEKVVAVARDITERKQAESDLENASRQAGMAEVASSVLHNVGNVLNSVNTSANVIHDRARKYPVPEIAKLVDLFEKNSGNLAEFLTQPNRAHQVIDFLKKLSQHMTAEQAAMIEELKELTKNVDHIKDIVSMQQSYAKVSGVVEPVKVADMIEDALRMHASALLRHDVHVLRDYSSEVNEIMVEKHKALQILVNLIHNAKHACDESERPEKELTLRVYPGGMGICIDITDNGIGILPENMNKIFNHGFTTRKDGHGFGLHSGALAAKEMGGTLQAHSDGAGKGATFTLSLPLQPKEHNP